LYNETPEHTFFRLMERIPEIDGLRALAALSVFAYHAIGFPALARFTGIGWIGVDLFFVISGYLITTILLSMRGSPSYFKNFYMRRTLRIFPPYYAFFLLCFVVGMLSRNYQWSGRLWLAFLFYATSLVAIRPWYPGAVAHLPGPARALEVTWSLSIEELFYLLWAPAVRFLKRRDLLLLILALILFAPIVRWNLHSPGQRSEYFFFPARMDVLAFGALLALWQSSGRRFAVPGWGVMAGVVASLFALLLTPDPQSNGLFAVLGYTLIAASMSLVMVFVLDHAASGNLVCRILRSGWLVRVGTVSYMFYLLHLFVIKIFRGLFANVLVSQWGLNRTLQLTGSLAATLLLAELSWRYFETPILRLKSRFAPKDSREAEHETVISHAAGMMTGNESETIEVRSPAV
jgi:peptidoglycan/LPS O-acetylase OafA/YrhL